MPRFAIGQYVELYPTVPSASPSSIESGTRAVVREIADDGSDTMYRVIVLVNEQQTGEIMWADEADLLEA